MTDPTHINTEAPWKCVELYWCIIKIIIAIHNIYISLSLWLWYDTNRQSIWSLTLESNFWITLKLLLVPFQSRVLSIFFRIEFSQGMQCLLFQNNQLISLHLITVETFSIFVLIVDLEKILHAIEKAGQNIYELYSFNCWLCFFFSSPTCSLMFFSFRERLKSESIMYINFFL